MAARSNPNIKKANSLSQYTIAEALEVYKCGQDPVYFCEKYVKVQHPKRGTVPLELYDFQKRMIRSYQHNTYSISLASRQVGKSTVAVAYLLWLAIFHSDQTILIASNKNSGAMEMIKRMQLAYEFLPNWLKPGIDAENWNKHSIGFDNKSIVHSTATSPDSGRGMSISCLYLDEFAFVPPSVQEEFWASITPTLSTGGSCIITSTPNGANNLFAKLWRTSEAGLSSEDDFTFFPLRVYWWEPPGRDEKFKNQQISILGKHMWLQEFECFSQNSTLTVRTEDGCQKHVSPVQLIEMMTS